MELNGAKIRNFYEICNSIEVDKKSSVKVNIPFYQRPYKWEGDRVKQLIDDYFDNKENTSNEAYFIGSVVTTAKEDTYHDLIDGQQRITTIFLVNYMKYLLLKEYLISDIRSRGINLIQKYDEAIHCEKNFFKEENLLQNFKETLIETINDYGGDEEKLEGLLNDFKVNLGISRLNKEEVEDYKKSVMDDNIKFLSEKKLCLKYSRKIYDEKLKKALSSIKIERSEDSGPTLIRLFDGSDKEFPIIIQYINSLEVIFEEFQKRVPKEKNGRQLSTNERLTKMISLIDDFMKYVNFCLIQTGNEDDAYTLFEVLNDRALALDPLDLIKNKFYQNYCQKNEELKIEKNLDKLEEMWRGETFKENLEDWKKNLILYCGTIYLTKDTSVSLKKKTDANKKIKSYLSKRSNYSFDDIKRDFYIFNFIKLIIESFGLRDQKPSVTLKSLEAENSNQKSIIVRTARLLKVLGQDEILISLINYILESYIIEVEANIEKESFEKYLSNLLNEKDNHNIIEFSYNIWNLAMLGKNYVLAKNYADEIIKKVFKRENVNLEISQNVGEKAKEEFKYWTSSWKYNNPDHKIRILFLKLLQSSKEEKELRFNSYMKKGFKSIDKIHMDHLEPNELSKDYKNEYFKPKNEDELREKYIDELGNFLLLKQKPNIGKSNLPLFRGLKYYYNDEMDMKGYWLLDEIEILLNENSELKNDIKIPTENFFIKRKVKLINYFYSVIINIEKIDKEENIRILKIMGEDEVN